MRTSKTKPKPLAATAAGTLSSNKRRLKISYRNMHLDCRTERVPQLRLQGKWLAKLGFPPESHVHVSATQGLLIISNIV